MVARRIEEATDAFLTRLRQTASCITSQPILALGTRRIGQTIEATFIPHSEPVRLRSSSRSRTILLDISIDFTTLDVDHVRGAANARIVSYGYYLLDANEHEILAFHWHPSGLSSVTDPHLHLSNRLMPIDIGGDQEPVALPEMHIPTGFVTLEDVVRLLITEFGITPRRDDWDAVLRDNRLAALGQQAHESVALSS